MPEQPADDSQPSLAHRILRKQVNNDCVVVARVQCDLRGAARLGDSADDIEGLVSIEGRDLDRHDVWHFNKPSPKPVREQSTAGGGLKIKAKKRNLPRDCIAMPDQFVVRLLL